MRRVLANIFSSWANLAVSVVIAFLVSPIIVKTLGKELYGVWTLVVSVTGYFTVLDFGVNTAIVRYISSCEAQRDRRKSSAVYSTSMGIFGATSLAILLFSAVFGYFFQDLFRLYQIPRYYLYAVFMVSAIDLATGLVCSVFSGALSGLQEFRFVNGSSLFINIAKSLVLVLLLKLGYALLTVALMQLGGNLIRALCQYLRLKRSYSHIAFSKEGVDRETVKLIYSYSIYSFVIAVALKLLFYTDSVVIGARIGVSEVVFYAIPSTLLDYLEKFIWSMIAVLVPIISANEATGEGTGNSKLYLVGTKYTLLMSLPVVIALFFVGEDFIRIWMGPEVAVRSRWVLRFLLLGFGVSFSQLIAHGILKGIGKHRALAWILAVEALANIVMSVALAGSHGIEGVAVGTMVPLVIASLLIMAYTCRTLGLDVLAYLACAYRGPAAALVVTVALLRSLGVQVDSYAELGLYSACTVALFWTVAFPLTVEREHKEKLSNFLRKMYGGRACESVD